jgi:hypothetical protein
MLETSSDLSDDVAVLQAMIALQNEKLSIFETEIKERDYQIEKLEHQLASLRRHRFAMAIAGSRHCSGRKAGT